MDTHAILVALAVLIALCVAAGPAGAADPAAVGIRFSSSDAHLAGIFDWARGASERWVGKDTDPVGPWYEASLPGREAFCIRDVSHQCIGGEVLGLGKQNRNMLGHFVAGIAESRDYCSFWEIDRHNRPAPVDYASDDDFWYNLNANFDIIDACYRLYQWTGDASYINGAAFDRFFHLTLNEYVERWQLQPDRIVGRPAFPLLRPATTKYRRARGIPSYDEGQADLAAGSDLVGMICNGYRTYARILALRGQAAASRQVAHRAEEYKRLLDSSWWDERSQSYYGFCTTGGEFHHGGIASSEFLLWYRVIDHPARIVKSLREIRNTQVEVLSYLPMLHYRYGFNQEGYEFLGKIHADPRRDYPEASFGAIEGIVCGLMGIEPSAADRTITTCPRLSADTQWAAAENVPVLGGAISVRHDGLSRTTFTNESGTAVTWRAMFQGEHAKIRVNGRTRPARHLRDAVGHVQSYVDVQVKAQTAANAEAAP